MEAHVLAPFTGPPAPMVLEPVVHGDQRGFFYESFNLRVFRDITGYGGEFVQDNHSRSAKGVLRGLHYQVDPNAQAKLVRVVNGSVFDVAVDIRRSSPTFGRWAGVELSEENRTQLWVPEGFAHGFYVLSDLADVVYKATAYYAPQSDRSIRFDDPDIDIAWPISVPPSISAKDQQAPVLADAEVFE